MKKILLPVVGLAILGAPIAVANSDKFRKSDSGSGEAAIAARPIEYSYGADPLQKLNFHAAPLRRNAPLVVFVHGGGWSKGDKNNATGQYKAPHYNALGYAFASINYRLVPDATVEQQAADIAQSLSWLRNNATRLGFNPSQIVLMGHSAGAHLVALIGTDPSYLKAAGLTFENLRGVIPLDGACYDVAAQMNEGPRFMRDTYRDAFGIEPNRQRALSPTLQAAAPNAPAFLILHVEREDGARQSRELAATLVKSSTPVELNAIKGKGLRGHMEINRLLVKDDYAATPIVDRWLSQRFK